MAYGVLYEFRRTSTNGADILITISQRDYEGEVKKRSLGRAPVIKRENNGHIYGTSCELYAECLIDGEFSRLYTSDAYEFRVEVYRNDSLLWMGFVSPELYSEPDVAPPYDVQIIATDGLGELKNFKFEKRGVASMLSHINYLMGKTGIGMALNIVSELRYVDDAGVASADKGVLDFKINLDHEEGSTCYDVLQNLLSSINANITQYNGRYLIFRETDFINKATEEGVEGFDVNGSAVSLPVASFGSMNQHKWWPIGQLSTVIEPAKNEVVLRSPDHYKDNVLDFDNWALANAASFNEEEGAYILPDEGSNISQYVDFGGVDIGYRLGLRVMARNVGITGTDQNIGIQVEINGRAWTESLGTQFWLRKSGGASTGHPLSDYAWNTEEDFVEEELRMPTDADTSADAQNIDIVIPLYDNANDVLGTFVYANDIKITIFNPAGIHDIYVYGVSLVKYEQIEGYEADVVINNAAREEEGDIELTMSAGDRAPSAGKVFMSGLPLLPSLSEPIKQWQVGDGDQQDYLSVMAYDYSRAIALPKMKYAGVLNVPGSSVSVPLLFLRDGTYYFPKTYSFNIYDDELEIELISISAADVSLSSVIISQMAQSSGNMGGLTTSGSGGGGVVSLPRDKEMSDTSDNAVENRVIKAYVDSEIKEVADLLTSMWRIEDNKIVTDMEVLVKNNLIVTGDTSSGGSGSDTPASGTVTGIKVNASDTLYPNTAGVIDMVDTLASIDVSDQLTAYAKTADVNSALALKQDTISDLATIRSGAALGATALQSITKKMVASALGASTGGRYLIDTGGDVSWGTIPTKLSQFTDDVVSGKYLPLSGGTLNGTLTINAGPAIKIYRPTGTPYIRFGRSEAQEFGELGVDVNNGNPVWWGLVEGGSTYGSWHNLIHSGNIGSQKVAGLVTPRTIWGQSFDGTGNVYGSIENTYGISPDSDSAHDIGSATNQYRYMYASWFGSKTGSTLSFGANNGTHMFINSSGNVTIGGSDLAGTAWKAYISGSTRIANVTITSSVLNANRNANTGALLDSSKMGFAIEPFASYVALKGYNTSGTGVGGLILNSSGNVTIGVSDLAGSDSIEPKLYISGNTRLAGSLYFNDGAYISYANIHLPSSDGSNGFNIYGAGNLMLASFYSDGKTILGRQGNVGIGTTSPTYKLDVNGGDIRTSSYIHALAFRTNGSYGLWKGSAFTSALSATDLALSATDLALYGTKIYCDGAVTMSSTLSVTTSVTSKKILTSGDYGLWKGSAFSGVYTDNDIALYATTIGVEGNVRPHGNNAFSLGTSSYQWSTIYGVNGIFSGDTSSGSDIRFKDIIKNKTIKIADIAKAPLFTFKWNDRDDDAIHLGSSAQYWEKVCPWLVTGEDFKSLNYATLGVAMGISLAKKAVNHEARIKELEREIKRLKEEMR